MHSTDLMKHSRLSCLSWLGSDEDAALLHPWAASKPAASSPHADADSTLSRKRITRCTRSSQHRKTCTAAAVVLTTVCALVFSIRAATGWRPAGGMWSSVWTGLAGRHCGGRRCGWTFVSYTSSPWEREWQEAVASGIENICPVSSDPLHGNLSEE